MRRVIKGLVRILQSYEIERLMAQEHCALSQRIELLETMLLDEMKCLEVLPDHTEQFTEAERTAEALSIFRKRKLSHKAEEELYMMQKAF